MKFLKFYNSSISNALLYGYSEKYNISPKIMELIVSRGYKTQGQIEKFLHPTKKDLHDPFLLSGMKELVDRIILAVQNREKVLIFGDYDVDGVSATAIMLKLFERLGMKADFYLPNRYIDGYGLTNDVLDKIKANFNPSLIITVDCGISCKNEVEYAKELGIEIYVTDHHEIPQELPQTVIVNAKLPNQDYPFDGLCGTGVAFKIAQAILGEGADDFLPIVAVATIADIVPLLDENRALVRLGLENISKLPLGVKMLAKELNLSAQDMTATDIAFKLAPKINASGRMGDAKDSLYLYLEQNPAKLKSLVKDIIAHNNDRQLLCSKVYDDCKRILSQTNMSNHRAIILASNQWDHGILGIVCAKLLEEYNRPVFLFAEDDGKLKGSARSLPDINVHILLTDMQDILETFGGHSVAAGLALKIDKFQEFKDRVEKYIFEHISDQAFIPIGYYDSQIDVSEITPQFLNDLKLLEPYGCDNQQPQFLLEYIDGFIAPMKNCPQHANILVGKKLSLVRFNYQKDYYKFKFNKTKQVIFEFQFSKFKSQYQKGILKQINSSIDFDTRYTPNVEGFALGQLCFQNLAKQSNFKNIDEQQFLKIVTSLQISAFGTAFVFYNLKNAQEFIANYNTENIYSIGMGEEIKPTGFNSILIAPRGVEWAKNFNRIVFVENVLHTGFISKINQISTAEIYLYTKQIDKNYFSKISLSRENFAKIYSVFKHLDNREFVCIQTLYNEFVAHKINFYDFYTAFLVFSDLQIVKTCDCDQGFKININDKIKVQLTNSKIYNYLNFIKNISSKK